MTRLSRIAFIGNSLPRRCGIATFTTDLRKAVAAAQSWEQIGIVAMNDHGHHYDYPPEVSVQINDGRVEDYRRAAERLNDEHIEVVSLQHEFGIFGGEAGGHIIELLSHLTMPVVTTLHTVLAQPSPQQRAVMDQLITMSAKLVVMAEKGREMLHRVYEVPNDRIEVIPHGIPDFAFVEPDRAKANFGFSGRPVILTFGLLSPGKGIEVVIDAMPQVLTHCPDAVYVVLGATHPNLLREHGESYRESLISRVEKLGIEKSVVFLNGFVDAEMLLDYITMCDVYVTPYLDEQQMTSGTLAYSYGLGRAVVSTRYWHAQELLAAGDGILVPFNDAPAIGSAITGLLVDDARRLGMRRRAYAASRSMTWPRTAKRYLDVFEKARRDHRVRLTLRSTSGFPSLVLPDLRTAHFLSMCDDTGLFQHAVHAVPDRSHGYCIDDNARALVLACALARPGEEPLPETLVSRFAAFVQHAWNPDARRFRNFMGFDRRWLEGQGSEDSHGRALWALGEVARSDANASRRRWAVALFAEALPVVESFTSPRAWAFALLGLEGYCSVAPWDSHAAGMRRELADRLAGLLEACRTEKWHWFEDGLSYDNARLPQALILAGMALEIPAYVTAGLEALRWLMVVQTARAGHFRPVGSESFGELRQQPRHFDQQPLEATATIAACLAAGCAENAAVWRAEANRAFAWFMGENDLLVPLVDIATGSCRDGLHPDRANENRGGESVVSYLLGLADLRLLERASTSDQPPPSALRARLN